MAQITNKRFTLLNNSGTAVLRLGYDASNFTDLTPNSAGELNFGAKTVYIGDTANANMTVGLTINQGAATNEILALKNSGVAHGITSTTETDTFGSFDLVSASSGGLDFRGLTAGTLAVNMSGIATTTDSTKSTAGEGAVHIVAAQKSGTSTADMAANTNLLVIRNRGTTRFIFDADGDAHADVSWTTF